MSGIRFGICGMGRFGKVHLRHFTASGSGFEVVALCDQDIARARGAAEPHGCAAYASYADFLVREDLELVIIVTRSVDHAANAEQALAAGKVVLLEKPIGVTAGDEQVLRRLVEGNPGKLFFCHNHRFEAAFTNAQEIIAEGLLGNIQVVKLRKHHDFMRRKDWQMCLDCGGGQLSVWGPHLIDQGLQLLGAPVRDIWSYLRRVLTPGDGDDHVKITLIGDNDRAVEVEISNGVALPGAYCSIYGNRGSLSYGQDQRSITLRYLNPSFRWPAVAAESGHPDGAMCADSDLPWIEEIRPVTPATDMWEHVETELVRHLHAALRLDVPFPVAGAEALEVVRVTELVKRQNPQFAWIG